MNVTSSFLTLITILPFLTTFNVASAASVKDWQGEWGVWTSQDGGSRLFGGSLSIFDCSEKTSTCRMRVDAESPKTRCGYTSEKGMELKIISADSSTAQFVDYELKPKDCKLELKLETAGGGGRIRAKLTGGQCGYFCTKEAASPELYPFRGKELYPWLERRECFADNRGSRQIWCSDPKIQAMDQKLGKSAAEYEELLHDRALYDKIPGVRESAFHDCQTAANSAVCLKSVFEKRIGEFEESVKTARRQHDKTEKSLSEKGDGAQASKLISQIEGVYKQRFENQLVDGSAFTSENILEIVKVTDDTVYFKIHLEFYNAHYCDLYGLARYSKSGEFVFNDPEPLYPESPGRLRFAIGAREITILDPGDTLKSGHCGARGAFNKVAFPKTARRTIKYMKLLKNSSDYKESVGRLNADK